MFSAGLGAFLRLERGGTRAELSRFLWTRGFWLVVLEFTVVRAGFFFDVTGSPFILLVFWALGMSMIALAVLVHLPYRLLLGLSVAIIALHNLFDGVKAAQFGAFAWAWRILHAQELLFAGPPTVIVAYPLVPWIGVMAAGYCCGRVYRLPPERRRAVLLRLGLALTAAFVVIRAINVYGDPRPWTTQASPVLTALSFLNTTKYPPSLAFLLMTLGPALVVLALVDRLRVGGAQSAARLRPRAAVLFRPPRSGDPRGCDRAHVDPLRGRALSLLPPPTFGTPRTVFPPDFGWDLWVVYIVWALVVAALYPACLWFMRLRARRREWWLSYL